MAPLPLPCWLRRLSDAHGCLEDSNPVVVALIWQASRAVLPDPKVVALVSPPRARFTRFHGVFAPNAKLRAQLTPSGRGKCRPADEASTGASSEHRSPDEKRRSMAWAQRLKRVFNIDVSTCGHCGGTVRIVASIEEPTAIRAILAHFGKYGALQ